MQMENAYTKSDIERIREEVKRRVSSSRFTHCCETADIAIHFARKVDYDESKVEVVALIHDIAREYTREQIDEIIEKYDIKLNRYNNSFPPSIHGKIGAVIAEKEFGIEDEEMLMAIRNHVSGRPCMKTLEQITFLADHMTRLHNDKPEIADGLMTESLNEATYHMLGWVIEYDSKHKRIIDERTLQTFDWLLERISNESKTGLFDVSEDYLESFYHRMDELLEMYSEHAIKDFPCENMRDLGGYKNADGRTIKKGKILRSGNPDRFTAADYEKLASMGINYVIDLRADSERKKQPELGNSGIHYIGVPFDSTGEAGSYLDTLLEWGRQCDDPEELAWLNARYFDSFDMDAMYKQLLFESDSREKYKKILEIMLRDDCTGIMYFCVSGKDRTGIISSVILSALNVDTDTVLNDYMVSQVPYYAITISYLNRMRRKNYNLAIQKQVFAVLGVESERPKRLNREILSRFSDYKEYFDFEREFSTVDVEHFREKYLE